MQDILKPKHNISHSFLVSPDVCFNTQHANEKVVLVVRQFPLTQLGWILNAIVISFLLLFLNLVMPFVLSTIQIFTLNIFGIVFIFAYVWINFLLWYFTVGMVTTERVIDLDFKSALYKEFTATTLLKVSDITTKVGGFFGSIFHYGDVFVKTEGFEQNIEFGNIPEPSEVVKIINSLMPDEN
jgi:hypothetical protein